MHPLYELAGPSTGPPDPARWSFTDLARWRECPRRWWLLNAEYPDEKGGARKGYPERYGDAAVRGRLVHETLDAYSRIRRTGIADGDPGPFSARLFMQRWLARWSGEERERNPRIDVESLRTRISLDECMAEFRWLAADEPPGVAPPGRRGGGTGGPWDTSEQVIELDDPPVKGRSDRVKAGRLVEYKTGEAKDIHEEQLLFYALLWWRKHGKPPAGLELVYSTERRRLVVPSVQELEALAERYRSVVAEARAALAEPPVQAKPSEESCRHCPVRQLCPEYWMAPGTRSLRGPGSGTEDGGYGDLRLTRLSPTGWKAGAFAGAAAAPDLGIVSVVIDRGRCPANATATVSEAYLLGARVEKTAAGWHVRLPASGEVFWK